MDYVLKFLGVDRLLKAFLATFNLSYLFRAVLAFFERLSDKRVDNESLYHLTLAAAARAETLYPEGHGWEKYKMVFDFLVDAGSAWVKEEVDDVSKAFGSWIDDEIQLAHAEISKIVRTQGNAALGSMSELLNSYAEASKHLVRKDG